VKERNALQSEATPTAPPPQKNEDSEEDTVYF
jgi:hypothetical protein